MDAGAADAIGNPVDQALDQLSVGLDHLVKLVEDGGLDHYDDAGFIGFLQAFEKVRNRLPLVDHLQSRSRPAGPGRASTRPM
jgi:hypothetical protein